MTATPLVLEQLEIRLGGRRLLQLDAVVAPGEIFTVMGPSGAGKSTLLAAIAGLAEPSFRVTGRVRLGAADLAGIAPEDRRIGILFQDPFLFPHLSVAGNLLFGMPPGRSPPDERRRRVEAALADADLAGFAHRDPATLSGGQQARVALLRVLLAEPRALLLDEPFAKLDAMLRQEIRHYVFSRIRHSGLPTILVTHDPADAVDAGGRVVDLARDADVRGRFQG